MTARAPRRNSGHNAKRIQFTPTKVSSCYRKRRSPLVPIVCEFVNVWRICFAKVLVDSFTWSGKVFNISRVWVRTSLLLEAS